MISVSYSQFLTDSKQILLPFRHGRIPGLITINQQQTIFCYKHGIFRWSGKKLLRMKVVIQRVSSAEVRIEDQVEGSIDKGLLILLGIENTDEKPMLNGW